MRRGLFHTLGRLIEHGLSQSHRGLRALRGVHEEGPQLRFVRPDDLLGRKQRDHGLGRSPEGCPDSGKRHLRQQRIALGDPFTLHRRQTDAGGFQQGLELCGQRGPGSQQRGKGLQDRGQDRTAGKNTADGFFHALAGYGHGYSGYRSPRASERGWEQGEGDDS